MVPVYSPLTESEASVISALLEAYQVPFFIRGGAFSKLLPGVQIRCFNTQTFMVPAEFYDLTRELLAEFINSSSQEIVLVRKKSIWRTLRVVMELVCFGWIITGTRWNKNDEWQA